MSNEIKANRPSPIKPVKEINTFDRSNDVNQTIENLEKGQSVLVIGVYGNGLYLLREIQRHLKLKMPNNTFIEQRKYREEYHQLSNLVLLEVKDHQVKVKKSPEIGWLEKLYPENKHFCLSFPKVQGLNSSWQYFVKGMAIPVLRNKLHPYYGTYFPTRFDHLILFDNWLKRYEGPKKTAIDVGVGSGVLSFQLVKHGFQKVFATDTNPNAIIGLKENMGDTKMSRKIELNHASLFGKWDKPTELIVFNPPWLPEQKEIDGVDEAIYYNDKLFPEFFEAAKTRLTADGKLVVIFSNLAQLSKITTEHPIEKELAEGGRFVLESCLKRAVKAASEKTKRDQHWREEEEVELWVMTAVK
jgi:predicted RNA methylase